MKSWMLFSVIFLSSCLCIFASVVDPEKRIPPGGGRTVRHGHSGQIEGQEESQPLVVSHLLRFAEMLERENKILKNVVYHGYHAISVVSKNGDALLLDDRKGEITQGNDSEAISKILEKMTLSCDTILLTVKSWWETRKEAMEEMVTILRTLEEMLKELYGGTSLESKSRDQQKRLRAVCDEVEALKVTPANEKPILEGGVVQNMKAVVENALTVAMEMSQMSKLERVMWGEMNPSLAIMEESLAGKTGWHRIAPVLEIAQMDLHLKEDLYTVTSLTATIKYTLNTIEENQQTLNYK